MSNGHVSRRAFLGTALAVAAPAEEKRLHRWYTLPLVVVGLPSTAECVPVSVKVDFTALLNELKAPGIVDPRSLRLVRSGGAEEPVQFTAAPQPRPKKRALLPGTPASVSYLAEYLAGEVPDGPGVAGELTWMARGNGEHRLTFGVLREGSFVQVPYGPQDLRAFGPDGRATPQRSFPHLQIRPQWPLAGQLHLHAGGQIVTSYHIGATSADSATRRPFLYPVNGPDGIGLTEFGKPHDPTGSHAHHYSLWVAHASVAGRDFWSEKGGRISHRQFERVEDGPVFCRLVHRTAWEDVLHERRTITLYRTPEPFRLLDIDLELSSAGTAAVTLGKTSFGFLAARVAQSMTVFDGGGEILNARGDRNERGAHLKKAEWLDQSGPVAPGRWGGVALFDHPDNPNHPTTWHCRNDGWAGAGFNAEAPHTIEPGKPLRLRYRVHLHRHDAAGGQVARRYAEYRARPSVRIGSPAVAD